MVMSDGNRATSSGLKQMHMDTSAYEMFEAASMTSMDGFLVLWETTNSTMVPFKFNQVSDSDAAFPAKNLYSGYVISPTK